MITFTETAARHVLSALASRGKGIGIRVGTKPSGCNGLAYLIEFCDGATEADLQFESYGATVVVSKGALLFFDGLEIDYVKKGLGEEGFAFNNPNVREQCGCGQSFST